MSGRGNRRVRRVMLAGFLSFQLGCYTAVPITGEATRPGTRVHVDLTDAGTVDMAREVGPRIRTLMGDVATVTDGELVVAMRSVTDVRGIESYWTGEQVTVPRRDIAALKERRLSRQKTTMFTVAILVGLVLTARSFGLFAGGDEHRGDLPVTQ